MLQHSTFVRLKDIETTAAIESKDQLENVLTNLERNIPRLEDMTEYGKPKGAKRIALVGGGPSLKDNLSELSSFRTIISCGSVHDYLISNGIIPTYATNCDPDRLCKNYFKKPDTEVKYLLSSNCHPELFEQLEGHQLSMWHCHSEEQVDTIKKIEFSKNRSYNGIGGGCTVGLRSISIAISFGYSNIHFFGFDSCMGDAYGAVHHAYNWAADEHNEEKIYKIKLGKEVGGEKNYYVAGYQLAQLEQFKHFYCAHRMYFNPVFHGEGAMADYYAMIYKGIDEILAKGAI